MNNKIQQLFLSNRWGLSLLFAAWLLFFGQVFLQGNVFFLDDLKIIYYPLEHAYAEFQENWDLPIWHNGFGFGHPLLAWGQLGFFTPLHVLLRVFGIHPLALLQISIAAYFLIGLLGMYAFLRQRNFGELSAAVGASVFGLGGFSIAHLNHVNFYTGTMLLPWLLIAFLALLKRPSLPRTGWLIVVAAAIALSAQPQIVVFIFGAAALLCIAMMSERQYRPSLRKTIPLLVFSGVVSAALASLAILPLLEFLPETERNDALPQSELLEFSYPPQHAITLILPYFYGDYESYWGAKGFQELTAFTGIIPLLLSGIALASWRTLRAERVVGIVCIVLAITMALGRYSLLYTFLVDNHYLTSLGVASRFVFFFDLGILLLAACGLEDIVQKLHTRRNLFKLSIPVLFLLTLFLPFLRLGVSSSPERQQLGVLLQELDPFLMIVIATLITIPVLLLIQWKYRAHVLAAISVATLVTFAWNYNPVSPARAAFAESPLRSELAAYSAAHPASPRLYSRPALLQSQNSSEHLARYSDIISPTFSAFQPLPPGQYPYSCVQIPINSSTEAPSQDIVVSIYENPRGSALAFTTLKGHHIGKGFKRTVCFNEYTVPANTPAWISITSSVSSNAVVAMAPQQDRELQTFLVRTANPTAEQWELSQKPFQLLITPVYDLYFDNEVAALARHMQVTEGASSARWIGALSIREYRNFIEFFFANDTNPFGGDERHVIERFRTIVNAAGITHLAQLLPLGGIDETEGAGFNLVSTTPIGAEAVRLYENPQAFPKAIVVPNAIWKPAADETRHAMSLPDFDPARVVYLSGPQPPETLIESATAPSYNANITRYTHTEVDVKVITSQPGYLVLSDSTTPQWQTYVDGEKTPRLVGNSIFKAAFVPAGEHTILFRYESPATSRAIQLSLVALGVTIGCIVTPYLVAGYRSRIA